MSWVCHTQKEHRHRGCRRVGKPTRKRHALVWIYELPDPETRWPEGGGSLWPNPSKVIPKVCDLDKITLTIWASGLLTCKMKLTATTSWVLVGIHWGSIYRAQYMLYSNRCFPSSTPFFIFRGKNGLTKSYVENDWEPESRRLASFIFLNMNTDKCTYSVYDRRGSWNSEWDFIQG